MLCTCILFYIYTFDFIGVLKSNAQLEGMLIDSENPGLIKWVIETYGDHSMLTQSCIPVKWNSSYFFACQSETPEGPGIPSDFLCEDVPGKHLSCQDGKHVHLLFPQQPDPIKYTATSIPVKKKKKRHKVDLIVDLPFVLCKARQEMRRRRISFILLNLSLFSKTGKCPPEGSPFLSSSFFALWSITVNCLRQPNSPWRGSALRVRHGFLSLLV